VALTTETTRISISTERTAIKAAGELIFGVNRREYFG
jgi:hypothetical protein